MSGVVRVADVLVSSSKTLFHMGTSFMARRRVSKRQRHFDRQNRIMGLYW